MGEEDEVRAGKEPLLPLWAPWALAFVLMALHDPLDRLYVPALFVALGFGLCATVFCLVVGARRRSRARAYWFAVGLLTLALATPTLVVLAPAAVLILVGLVTLLVARRWFSAGPQGPPPRIQSHVACALTLWFLSWFVVLLSHGRNGILLVVPSVWILWTIAVTYRNLEHGTARRSI